MRARINARAKSLSRLGAVVILPVFVLGCGLVSARHANLNGSASSDTTSIANSSSDAADVSLKGDKGEIERLRKAIPEDRRKRNDDLKDVLQYFGEVRLPPEEIQEKYDQMFERQRDQFNRLKEKEREQFDKQEQKDRDAFDKQQKAAREDFLNSHHSSDDRETFFNDQEAKRQDFNDTEHEKRDEFNTGWHERTDDFNSDVQDKRQEFQEQFREYSHRYNAWQKSLEDKKQKQEDMDELRKEQRRTQPDAAAVNPLFNGQ